MKRYWLWNDRVLSAALWALNTGLLAMVLLSILPIGSIQTWASVEHGDAFARSPELLQRPLLRFFRWMRVSGDVLFAVGIGTTVAFIVGFGRRAVRPGAVPSLPPRDSAPAPAE